MKTKKQNQKQFNRENPKSIEVQPFNCKFPIGDRRLYYY